MSKLGCQKDLFSLDPDVRYINGAYMSPMLKSVESAGMEGMFRKRSPNGISQQDFFTDVERIRPLFAQLVNAPSSEDVAIIPSASYGTAITAKNLPCRAGQKIVVAEAQFPSNVYPWMNLAREKGLDLEMVPMPEAQADRGKIWNQRLLDAIDDRTALVTVGHIHWATGTLFNLKALAEKVHRHGGLIVVDATQSVGALPMDVRDFGLDALVCAAYKWLLGPYSLGYAWIGPAFLKGSPLEENWVNRRYSEDFAGLTDYQDEYQAGARRFDMGERSNFISLPMGIAALEQLLAWNPANIQEYCRELVRDAVPQWQKMGYGIDDEAFRASHLFGLELPSGLSPLELQARLREDRIFVSVRGKFVRISPNVYNDPSDIEALTKALASV